MMKKFIRKILQDYLNLDKQDFFNAELKKIKSDINI
jgi:hypothetical protein